MNIVIPDSRQRVFVSCCEACDGTAGTGLGLRGCDEWDGGEEGIVDGEEGMIGEGDDGEGVGGVVGFVVGGWGFWWWGGRRFDGV